MKTRKKKQLDKRFALEDKLAEAELKGFIAGHTKGQQEICDVFCSWLGRSRAQQVNNPVAYNAQLEVQAHAEGMRLLAYFYEETDLLDLGRFEQRFYDSRRQDVSSVVMFRRNEVSDIFPHVVGGTNAVG